MSESKTYDYIAFSQRLGISTKQFVLDMRAGAIPAPLSSAPGRHYKYLRWGSATVEARVAGKYTGPMMSPDTVPPARPAYPAASKAPKAPKTPKTTKTVVAAPAPTNTQREGRGQQENSARALFDLLGFDGEVTREVQIVKHRDGSVTLKPAVSAKN